MKSTSWDKASQTTAGLPAGNSPEADLDEGEDLEQPAGWADSAIDALRAFGDAPSWVLSLCVHGVIMLVLASVVSEVTQQSPEAEFTSLQEDEHPMGFDTVVMDHVGTPGPVNSMSAVASAASSQGQAPQQQVQQQLDNEILPGPGLGEFAVEMPGDTDITQTVGTSGSTERPAGGTGGAIDHITYEIATSLKERKTLVVWMFDASLSMKERRDDIADRFENIYQQLDSLEVGADKALKTAVASFGQKTEILTPEPVDDIRPILQKVRSIPNDTSGKEFVFAAIKETITKWQTHRTQGKRNMIYIIVTDERGDDFETMMEPVIASVRRLGIKFYVIGNASPFGQQKGYVNWKFSDGSTEDIPVDQGPESAYPDTLQLAFWGADNAGLNRMSSGYGPYALTRLCAETGGMYLIAADDLNSKGFNHEVMRNYAPDYRPLKTVDAEVKKNKAKMALVAAAMGTSVKGIPIPQTSFQADTDATLRTQIGEAQKPLADLDYRLGEIYDVLSQGEKDRVKISEPRWQATYDLAMGRTLAMRVRAFGYNTVLAEMKATPKVFEKKGSNNWNLVPSKEITSGPNVKKLALKASEYLKRVIDNHPETPWAILAERELSTPMGWEWKESTVNIPGMGQTPEERAKQVRLAEEQRKKEAEKRKIRDKERPVL